MTTQTAIIQVQILSVFHVFFSTTTITTNSFSLIQTFLPYPDLNKSASVLDDKRLGKQRVECLQILQTLAKGPIQRSLTRDYGFKYNPQEGVFTRRTPWYNHPAVRMWKGWECTLVEYASCVCREWTKRGYKDTCMNKINAVHFGTPIECHSTTERQQGYNEYYTPWLGNPAFHAAHRSNLLRKNPTHYSQFGWTEPHDLPYIWPV